MKKLSIHFSPIRNRKWLKPLFLFLLLFSVLPVSAQWSAGLSLGYANNTLNTDTGYAYDRRYESMGGLSIGIPVQYQFTDWFGLRAEAVYIQKGYKMHRTGILNAIYTNTRNHYLQVPLLADFSFGGERLRGFLHAGGFLGGWLSSRRQGVTVRELSDENGDENGLVTPENEYRFNEKAPFDSRRDNRFEAGLAGGVGLSYRVLPYLRLELEGRCYYSLTDLQKNYMKSLVPRYNTTFVIQAGCLFMFGQTK